MAEELASKQLAGFIAKFDPPTARLIRAVRSALRKRLPAGFELVYDNYNFFVIGFGSTERASDCVVSLVASARGVSLCFIYGASLPDPRKILQGSGKQTRFIRMESARNLLKPEVEALLAAALEHAKTPMPATGRNAAIVKSVSAKQRPRKLLVRSPA